VANFTSGPESRLDWIAPNSQNADNTFNSNSMAEALKWDRQAYRDRYSVVFYDNRIENPGGAEGAQLLNCYKADSRDFNEDGGNWYVRAHVVFPVPGPLPGSDNSIEAAEGDGRTSSNSGTILVFARVLNAEVCYRIRRISIDGNGGATALTDFTDSRCTVNLLDTAGGGTFNLEQDFLLFPPSTQLGDLCELQVLYRQQFTEFIGYDRPGYVSAFAVYLPPLLSVQSWEP
jgi:hypothetical protein